MVGTQGQSCTDACAGLGLICDLETIQSITSAELMISALGTNNPCGENPERNFYSNLEDGDWEYSPNISWDHSCYFNHPNSETSGTTCERAKNDATRLCHCKGNHIKKCLLVSTWCDLSVTHKVCACI